MHVLDWPEDRRVRSRNKKVRLMRPTMFYIAAFILITILAGVAMAAVSDTTDPNLNLDGVVEAIRQCENWDGRSIGGAGELGPFQMRPAVWRQFSSKPIGWSYGSSAEERAEQRATAKRMVLWIDDQLRSLHLSRNAWSFGLTWNAGYGNVRDRDLKRRHYAYANRVQNIYDDISKPRSAKPIFQP